MLTSAMVSKSRWLRRFLGVLGLALIVIAVAMTWTFVQGGHFQVRSLVVDVLGEVAELSSHEKYRNLILEQVSGVRGLSIFSVNAHQVSQRLLAFPWIEEVWVQTRLPSEVRVTVRLKPVAALILVDKKTTVPVAKDATLFPPLPYNEKPQMTVFRQRDFVRDAELREKTIKILNEIPNDGKFNRAQVSEVAIDAQNSLWFSLMEKDFRVRLGAQNVPLQAKRISKVLDYLDHNNLQARVIDADFSKKVVVKLRKGR